MTLRCPGFIFRGVEAATTIIFRKFVVNQALCKRFNPTRDEARRLPRFIVVSGGVDAQ
jgi:hypothetical protein